MDNIVIKSMDKFWHNNISYYRIITDDMTIVISPTNNKIGNSTNILEHVEEDDMSNLIRFTSFCDVDKLPEELVLLYLDIFLNLNENRYEKEFVRILHILLIKVSHSQKKGKFAEKAFDMVIKPFNFIYIHTWKNFHSADYIINGLYMVEIKNCSSYSISQFYKLCYDMNLYYELNGKFLIGIFIHSYDDNFYDIDHKIIDINNFIPYTPFIAIPFKEISEFDNIINKANQLMSPLCNRFGYEKIIKMAEKHITKKHISQQNQKIEQLQAENARLQAEIARLQEVQAENARLKELLTLNNIPFS